MCCISGKKGNSLITIHVFGGKDSFLDEKLLVL